MTALSLFLVPQQLILWCSAFNGLYCTFIQQYADGTKISWPHILTDQSPVIFMALLYTVALLESRHPPDFGDSLVGRSTKGEQGIQGIQGIPGPAGVAGVQGEVGPAGATGIGGRGGRGGKGGAGGKGGDAPAELGAPGEQGSVGEQSGNK